MKIDCKTNKQGITSMIFLLVLVLPFMMSFLGMHKLLSSQTSIICTSVLLTICWIFNFTKTTYKKDLCILICVAVSLLLNLLFSTSLGVIANFYNYILFFLLLRNLSFSKRQMIRIRIAISACLAILLFSFNVTAKYGFLSVTYHGSFVNTNTYGVLWLVLCYNLILLIDLCSEGRWKIALSALVIVGCTKFIWDSKCRTAIIALIFFCVLCVSKKWNYKKILLAIVLTGIIFPYLYILLYQSYSNIEILGKSLFSGRQTVWLNVWEYIKSSPILGSGTENMIAMGGGSFTDSAHNVYLGIWKTLGLIPLITFIFYLFQFDDYNTIGKKAFLSCILMCIFETLLTDPNYNLIFISLLMSVQTVKPKGVPIT